MSWADTYAIEFVEFDVSRTGSTYGGGTTYGEATFGQESSDPLGNINLELAPHPSQWPADRGWEFHVGDIGGVFQAVLLGLNGPEPLANFARAALIIERMSVGPRVIKAFPITLTDPVLEYEWVDGDLSDPGTFRVLVQLVSNSDRALTVSGSDQAVLYVKDVG